MGTVLRVEGFRFEIRTREGHRLPHVHVYRGSGQASIAIETAEVLLAEEISRADQAEAERIVGAHRFYLLAKWREIHG